ncbi:MAG: hypothetical protein ABIO16_17965 [Nocardioides sp.]
MTLTASIARLLAGALLTGTAVVGATTTAAHAADRAADDEPTACQQVWEALPTAMKDDVGAALPLPLRQRRAALREVRQEAVTGGYGDQVQAWAEEVLAQRQEIWQNLPDDLKADILAARSLPLREQRRAMLAIRYAALHGEYGADVQALAEKRQAFRQGCPGAGSRAFLGGAADLVAA